MAATTKPAPNPSSTTEARSIEPGLLAAYPTLRCAATMIGVSPSTLSRLPSLQAFSRGSELRIPPREVLRLVRYYKRRTDYEAGGELTEFAIAHAPEFAAMVENEVQAAFRGQPNSTLRLEEFLAEAQRSLPADLYEQICSVYEIRQRRRAQG